MPGASISDSSCASRSASARRADCRIARRPSWPRFWRYCAPPDAGWSRFPHGTHPWPLCAAFRHPSPPPPTPQRRPLSPRAARASMPLPSLPSPQFLGGGVSNDDTWATSASCSSYSPIPLLVAGALQRLRRQHCVVHCSHIDIRAFTIGRGRAGHIDDRAVAGLEILIDQTQLEDPLVWIDGDSGVRHRPVAIGIEARDSLPQLAVAIVLIRRRDEPSS